MDQKSNTTNRLSNSIIGWIIFACIVCFFIMCYNFAFGFLEEQRASHANAEIKLLEAQTAEAKEKRIASCSAHRFERVEVYPINLRADIALDSCTGKLCRTWNWESKQETSAWSTYASAPLCGAEERVTPTATKNPWELSKP